MPSRNVGDFWTTDRRNRLVECLSALGKGISEASYFEDLSLIHAEGAAPEAPFISDSTLGRALKATRSGKPYQIKNADQNTSLLRVLEQKAGMFGVPGEIRAAVTALAEEFNAAVRTFEQARAQRRRDDAEFGRLMQRYFHITTADLTAVKDLFFFEKDPPEISFLVYRFDSASGDVVKSFLRLRAPTETEKACVFANHVIVGQADEPRVTKGVVVPMSATVSFIGEINEGSGIVFVTFERPIDAMRRYDGLVITFDSIGKPIATRVVFIRTDHVEWSTANIATHREDAIQAELEPIRDGMLNRIPFTFDKVIHHAGEPVAPDHVPVMARDLFRDKSTMFTCADSQEFNPFDHNQFRYNAALKIGENNSAKGSDPGRPAPVSADAATSKKGAASKNSTSLLWPDPGPSS